MENNTNKYPDVIQKMPEVMFDPSMEFIVDGEVVVWDVNKKVILPFLHQRRIPCLSYLQRKKILVKEIL